MTMPAAIRPTSYQPYNRAHSHGLDDTAGHVVVHTMWETVEGNFDLRAEDASDFYAATAYGNALVRKNELVATAGKNEYYVIDTVYADGCRSYLGGRCVA
jgi:hypothetical protein